MSTADKDKLADQEFAFPEERKEPLTDARHVRACGSCRHWSPPQRMGGSYQPVLVAALRFRALARNWAAWVRAV